MYQFKAKYSKIKSYSLCLGNILKDFTIDNMRKTGLIGVAKFLLLIIISLLPTMF